MATYSSNKFIRAKFDPQEYVSNTYVQGYLTDNFISNGYTSAVFTSNNYVIDTYVSNTYAIDVFASNSYSKATFTSNSYVQDRYVSNNYLDTTLDSFSSNVYLQDTFASNTYVVDIFTSNNYLVDHLDSRFSLRATNTYVNSTFTSNNYVDGRFASNTYVTTKLGLRATNTYLNSTFSSNNYLQDQLDLKATNTYVNSTFTSNNYVDGKFASNTYATSKLGLRATNTYVNSTFVSNNYLDGTFTSNSFIISTFASNNYVQDHVATEVAAIVNAAPSTLDTLNELAAALGDDPNFATTISNQIGLRATNTYVNSTFSSNTYLTANYVSNTYLTGGQIPNINVSQLQVGEEDSAAGGLLTVYGRQTGDSVGGEIRLHTAADHDTNIPYYAIKTSGEDFIIELDGGTDVITIDYSSGAVDIPTGVLEVGRGDSQYGIIHVHGDHTGSSLGGFVRIYSPADYDSTINYYNIKVYQDDFIMEKSDGVNIFTYYGSNGETRFDNPAYVSIGTPDSWYGDLRLHGNGAGSIYGGILRFYTAADHDSTIDHFTMKVTYDDWHFERNTGQDIISYFGGNDELRLGPTTAYVSVGASDSSKGSLYLWSDGAGSVNGGELRIYNAPDHDANVNYYSLYAESGDFLISYGSTDFLKYDESESQWSFPQSNGISVTGPVTAATYNLTSGGVLVSNNWLQTVPSVSNNYLQSQLGQTDTALVTEHTGTGANSISIDLTGLVGSEVFVNGLRLPPSDFVANVSSNTVSLELTLESSDHVTLVRQFGIYNYADDALAEKVSNNYVLATFTSNNYATTALASNSYSKSTFTANNYVQDRYTSNNYMNTGTTLLIKDSSGTTVKTIKSVP